MLVVYVAQHDEVCFSLVGHPGGDAWLAGSA